MNEIQSGTGRRRLGDPLQQFIKFFTNGSALLMMATAVAVIWANVDHDSYHHFWHSTFGISSGLFSVEMGLTHWINDGLMAIFFFVVGLEIKREFLAGELSSFKQASLPIFAAIGGMVVPIILYFSFGFEGTASKGWGIPMATDIAFSLGILSLLGKRVPLALKVFLTALAIVDDLGAVLVIALFYGGDLNWTYLMIAGILLLVLTVANLKNIQDLKIYTFLGFIIWYLFLQSGVDGPGSGLHATIAGVLIAFTIPARPKVHINEFLARIKSGLTRFDSVPKSENERVLTDDQLYAINDVEYSVKKVQSPLQYIEHQFHGFISLFVLPIFALANAGVTLVHHGDGNGDVFTTLSFAIAFSLVAGKGIGITVFSWLAVRLGFAVKPKRSSWMSFLGLGFLGGIGFTMSIFIASLGFKESAELLNQAKIGIFVGSIVAGLFGFYLLKYSLKKDEERKPITTR
ncbi:Na+/H+ antiporter NhaA [Carboxylicivirga sediminis]|uniref:Na(+)/H(+) antiporter NhaA n=1 Tax=Carboxylicivirga sediminis TaxID=2006564 RepID=A0A941F746_9BACT|nr:Na+/H+ antiporter NhaA [Carboxylicivirga sediminis]MBR8537677.1 Na+/H+ antiporter NhaA [Carboxylicivirga sediminis]